jgi:TPR repeat protein
MYREGRGVQRDQAEALKWYHKAARQKNATAMFNLGTAYYNGDGVGINDTLSCAWFLLAKEQGSPNAKEALSKDGKKLLSTDLVSAWFVIAMMYRKGEDLERNDAEAIKWLTKAADNGNPDAKVQIATMYANGQGVPKDFGRVLELCESAAKQNYGPGSYCVGVIHRQGLGIAKDSREALKWFRNAAEQNHSGAAMVLVDMYEKGEGTEVNRVEAYYWLFMAFTEGVTDTHERAAQLWRQMQPSDIKHLEKKLQGLNYDPKKVFKELGTEIPQA